MPSWRTGKPVGHVFSTSSSRHPSLISRAVPDGDSSAVADEDTHLAAFHRVRIVDVPDCTKYDEQGVVGPFKFGAQVGDLGAR